MYKYINNDSCECSNIVFHYSKISLANCGKYKKLFSCELLSVFIAL